MREWCKPFIAYDLTSIGRVGAIQLSISLQVENLFKAHVDKETHGMGRSPTRAAHEKTGRSREAFDHNQEIAEWHQERIREVTAS